MIINEIKLNFKKPDSTIFERMKEEEREYKRNEINQEIISRILFFNSKLTFDVNSLTEEQQLILDNKTTVSEELNEEWDIIEQRPKSIKESKQTLLNELQELTEKKVQLIRKYAPLVAQWATYKCIPDQFIFDHPKLTLSWLITCGISKISMPILVPVCYLALCGLIIYSFKICRADLLELENEITNINNQIYFLYNKFLSIKDIKENEKEHFSQNILCIEYFPTNIEDIQNKVEDHDFKSEISTEEIFLKEISNEDKLKITEYLDQLKTENIELSKMEQKNDKTQHNSTIKNNDEQIQINLTLFNNKFLQK